MRFPGERMALFQCGFDSADTTFYRLVGTKGQLRVEPAYELAEGLTHYLTTGSRTRVKHFPKRDQFAPELLYFSDCVRANREPEPSGIEGLADVRVIEAIYESAESGKVVRLDALAKSKRPGPAQEIHCPPFEKPRLVNAAAPH